MVRPRVVRSGVGVEGLCTPATNCLPPSRSGSRRAREAVTRDPKRRTSAEPLPPASERPAQRPTWDCCGPVAAVRWVEGGTRLGGMARNRLHRCAFFRPKSAESNISCIVAPRKRAVSGVGSPVGSHGQTEIERGNPINLAWCSAPIRNPSGKLSAGEKS